MSFARDAFLLALGVALATGAAARAGRPLLRGLSRAERWAWAFWLGVLAVAGAALAGVALGIPGGSRAIPAFFGIVLLATFLRKRRVSAEPPEARLSPAGRILLFGAALAVASFTVIAVSEPMWSNDFLAIWGFKGKTIFLSGSIPGRLFHDSMTAWSHPEYPLLLPLALAGFSALPGVWDDHALALLYPIFQVALVAMLYGWTKRRYSPGAAAWAAVLAACNFALFRPLGVGMAEIPLAAALVFFAAAVLDFADDPSRSAGARLAIAALAASAVKQEGALFVLLVAGWVAHAAGRRRRGFAIAFLSLTAVPAICHAIVLTALRGTVADRDYDLSFAQPEKWSLLPPRAFAVLETVFRTQIASAWMPLGALAVFFLLARPAGREDSLRLLGPPLLAQAGAYAAICAFSAFDPVWQAQFLPRLAGALFPVLLLAAAPRLESVCAGPGAAIPGPPDTTRMTRR